MRFAYPWLLLLLLVLPVLAWLKSKTGRQGAFLYSSVDLVKNIVGLTRSSVGAILLRMRWVSLALFLMAFARPQMGEGQAKIHASGIDIVLVMDVSGSMASEDFEVKGEPTSRLTIAKDVIEKFVQ